MILEDNFLQEIGFRLLVLPGDFIAFCEQLLAEQVDPAITEFVGQSEYAFSLMKNDEPVVEPVVGPSPEKPSETTDKVDKPKIRDSCDERPARREVALNVRKKPSKDPTDFSDKACRHSATQPRRSTSPLSAGTSPSTSITPRANLGARQAVAGPGGQQSTRSKDGSSERGRGVSTSSIALRQSPTQRVSSQSSRGALQAPVRARASQPKSVAPKSQSRAASQPTGRPDDPQASQRTSASGTRSASAAAAAGVRPVTGIRRPVASSTAGRKGMDPCSLTFEQKQQLYGGGETDRSASAPPGQSSGSSMAAPPSTGAVPARRKVVPPQATRATVAGHGLSEASNELLCGPRGRSSSPAFIAGNLLPHPTNAQGARDDGMILSRLGCEVLAMPSKRPHVGKDK